VQAFLDAVVRDRATAEDLFQQVALILWKDFARYDPARPFGPWARGIAANLVLRHFRARERGLVALDEPAIEALLAASNRVFPEAGAHQAALDECMDELPERSRRLLRLRYGHGMDVAQIAVDVGGTHEAVRKALVRLRSALRDCARRRLAAQGGPS
jgi:RNA polymerase sigma-70 factor (ECF subfamily)